MEYARDVLRLRLRLRVRQNNEPPNVSKLFIQDMTPLRLCLFQDTECLQLNTKFTYTVQIITFLYLY